MDWQKTMMRTAERRKKTREPTCMYTSRYYYIIFTYLITMLNVSISICYPYLGTYEIRNTVCVVSSLFPVSPHLVPTEYGMLHDLFSILFSHVYNLSLKNALDIAYTLFHRAYIVFPQHDTENDQTI
jgi:hypothetical protein